MKVNIHKFKHLTIEGSGPKYFDLVFWVDFFCCLGQTPLGLEISTKNPKFFHFITLGQKITSGGVKKYQGQGGLFTSGQKHAWVESGLEMGPDPTRAYF